MKPPVCTTESSQVFFVTKQIERGHPEQQQGRQGGGGMAEDVAEVPVLDPLIEAGVFEVPPTAHDLQGRQPGGADVGDDVGRSFEGLRRSLTVVLDSADLEIHGVEPTNNAAERALRQSVIQRKISLGVQSSSGATCRSRLLTVTTTLRQQGRDTWQFLEQAWIAHHRGGVMPSLLPDP
jgi:hypothetical protein